MEIWLNIGKTIWKNKGVGSMTDFRSYCNFSLIFVSSYLNVYFWCITSSQISHILDWQFWQKCGKNSEKYLANDKLTMEENIKENKASISTRMEKWKFKTKYRYREQKLKPNKLLKKWKPLQLSWLRQI